MKTKWQKLSKLSRLFMIAGWTVEHSLTTNIGSHFSLCDWLDRCKAEFNK